MRMMSCTPNSIKEYNINLSMGEIFSRKTINSLRTTSMMDIHANVCIFSCAMISAL